MSLQRLVVWIIFLGVFAMAARVSMDTDTWWHLRAGQWIVEHRQVPRTDEFSYTRYGASWHYPGWLVEVPMYGLYRMFGPGGLNLWTAGMVSLTFVFIWGTLSGGVFLRAFVVLLAATASGIYWAARPYLVTFLFSSVFLWALESYRWRRNVRWLWVLPILMAIWANSHGGFIVGFILWAVYWSAEAIYGAWKWLRTREIPFSIRRLSTPLLWIGVLMAGGVCLNPYGAEMLLYPFKTVNIGVLRDYIQEWQSPQFHSLAVQPFAWLLFLTLGAVGISRRRLALIDFALAAGFGYLGLLAGRNIAFYSVVSPMVITRHLAPIGETMRRRFGFQSGEAVVKRPFRILNLVLAGILLVAAVLKAGMVIPRSINEAAFEKYLPVEAVNYIRYNRPPGRLFNPYNWGGYLLWSLPEYPVFVDGRTDLYNDEVIRQWMDIYRAETDWEEKLDSWDVRIVLSELNSPLDKALRVTTGWKLVYRDALAVIYIKE